jgi:aspartyl-tRNA(Asn)/glutamyl-tRNA(Gln) amidotransferase subunit B
MNSFRSVERAINYEAERQYVAWQETGRTIKDEPKTTRGWDDVREHTFIQREKEESADYRYFPDPDLPPVRIPREHVESIRETLGELPAACRKRLESEYQIKPYDADVIVNQGPSMIAYFESVAIASGDGRRASNWILQDVMRALKERDGTIETFPLPAITLGVLLRRVTSGNLDNARAREAFAKAIETGQSIDEAVDSMGIRAVDASALDDLCRQILNANPQVLEDFKAGKVQAIGALIGQARKINPNANPQSVRESLLKLLNSQ